MANLRVKTSGLNSARTLSELVKQGIEVRNVSRDDNALVFNVPYRQKTLTIHTLKRLYLDFSISMRKSFIERIINPWRIGIAIGLILCLTIYSFMSTMILRIDVSGISEAKTKEIVNFLSNNGIGVWTSKKSINTDEVDAMLYRNFDLSVAETKLVGVTMAITLKEELSPPEYGDLTTPLALIAAEDALVSRIVCAQGTKSVEIGQSIKKGTTLISAFKTVGDEKISIRAIGEVYGKVWREKEFYLSNQKVVYQSTGRVETRSVMRIGDVGGDVPTSSFAHYKITKSSICIGDFLPIYKDTYIFTEQQAVTTDTTEQDVKLLIEKAKKDIILENVNDNGEFIRCWTTERKTEDGTVFKVIAEFEKRIDIYA